jgi:hypothetical protein
VNFVRLTYWLGALIDIGAGVQLLTPLGATVLGFPGMRYPGAAGLPAVIAAVLMFGFAAVLVWAHRRTVDRRVVLPITLVVVIALAAANIAFAAHGVVTWAAVAPPLAIQVVLATMFAVSTVLTVRKARSL